ncbi:hypothetical protein G7Y79_00046g081990 [Physcia stellaris]|nr:hypothetical protein G7Y79_00046g081990 [Physcia stellaris]
MLIDALPPVSPRPVPMKVLALGMSRTGTMCASSLPHSNPLPQPSPQPSPHPAPASSSPAPPAPPAHPRPPQPPTKHRSAMQHALQKLGLKTYHMVEAGHTRTFTYWYEALRAKYAGEGRPYQRAEFDKLLGEYSAITDIPCILFADELLAAYPDALVILTERDEASWLVSMEKTILELWRWKSWDYFAPFDPKLIAPFWKTYKYILHLWCGGPTTNKTRLLQTYREHYAHIRSVVPRERLLEFRRGDGYKQLCEFLGEEVPGEEDYPHVNRPDEIIGRLRVIYWVTVAMAVAKIGGAVAVAGGAVWYAKYRG